MSISQINAASIQAGTVVASDIAANTITPSILTIGAPYWNSSNQVGIGTSAPGYPLDVQAATGIVSTKSTNNLNTSYFISNNGAGATAIGIDSSSGTLTGVANASFVWSSVNSPLIFSQNSTERMRIDTNGNIGIGVTPAAATRTTLQIGAYATIDNNAGTGIEINSNAVYNSGWKYINSAAATQYYQYGGTHVWQYAASGTASSSISWTEAMRITPGGNVAIGSTSANFSLSFGANVGKFIALYESSGTNQYGIGMGGLGTTPSPYRTQLFANGSEYVSITATGNVGIGTVTPGSLLTVNGQANISGTTYIGGTSPGGIGLFNVIGGTGQTTSYFASTDSNNTGVSIVNIPASAKTLIAAQWNTATTALAFGLASTEYMRIHTNGYVGIGTTNPSYTLDVTGNVRFSLGNNSMDFANGSGTPFWRFYPSFSDGAFYISRASGNPTIASANDVIKVTPQGALQLLISGQPLLSSSGRPMVNQTGGILAVYQATNNTVYSLGAGTNVALTGMSVTLTPSSSSSRFLILFSSAVGYGGGATHAISVARNGTSLNFVSGGTYNGMIGGVLNGGAFPEGGILYVDSPATTSSITYTLVASNDGTLYVGKRNDDFLHTSQQMVVMEIAG